MKWDYDKSLNIHQKDKNKLNYPSSTGSRDIPLGYRVLIKK